MVRIGGRVVVCHEESLGGIGHQEELRPGLLLINEFESERVEFNGKIFRCAHGHCGFHLLSSNDVLRWMTCFVVS